MPGRHAEKDGIFCLTHAAGRAGTPGPLPKKSEDQEPQESRSSSSHCISVGDNQGKGAKWVRRAGAAPGGGIPCLL